MLTLRQSVQLYSEHPCPDRCVAAVTWGVCTSYALWDLPGFGLIGGHRAAVSLLILMLPHLMLLANLIHPWPT